ncbi:MAG TPA: trypsin-like peptidase domain-containing protein [Candidatus Limnocylindrales bacterium]|nr:trypsin-like peptidase domain-containing protein [Candidatus Limnocylindrales bacterium]
MAALDDLSTTITDIATRLGPSVVGIGSRLRGTGFVVADGAVATNAHNLRGDQVTIRFADGRVERGPVAGVDADGDLAVVSVDTSGAVPLEWESEEGVAVGRAVFGLGATADGGPRVTFGLVSAVERAFRGPGGRRIEGSIEHTAPLAPGSSGGPLVDAGGRLVGVNTNRLGDAFYLALPATAALRDRLGVLARGESVRRPRLGVAVAPPELGRRLRRSVGLPDRDGLLVRGVEDGSPAAAAGIREGDLLVAAAGRPLTTADDLHSVLSNAGLPLEVTIVRGAEELTVSAAPVSDASGEG